MADNSHSTPSNLSRRALLRASVLSATSLIALKFAHPSLAEDEPFDPGGRVNVQYDETISFNEQFGYPPMLGRSEIWGLPLHASPTNKSDVRRKIHYDEVVPIYNAVNGDAPAALAHNPIWYHVGDGYIHSSYLVPVKEEYHEPEEIIGSGFWGEITVPTSWQHWEPKLRSVRYYDLAYGTVYKVIDRQDESDGRAWYRIVDDLTPGAVWWVQARHVRRIPMNEFIPISPRIDPTLKRIEISLRQQTLTCYEDEMVVFKTRIASGASFFDAVGNKMDFGTPYGTHQVVRKTPSRHMVGGEDINDIYDLPGVAWCTYFTYGGAAIHGTYWHNDFGHPRSHGCVNVTNDAAHWIYRWVNPFAGYQIEEFYTARDMEEIATRIIVDS